MPEFLLNLTSEEIPARFQSGLEQQLIDRFLAVCHDAGLDVTVPARWVSPRHVGFLAVVPSSTKPIIEEKRGPRVDAPLAAHEAFFKANHTTAEQCTIQEQPKGSFYVYTRTLPAEPIVDFLSVKMAEVLLSLTFPKSMVWNDYALAWVRPLRHICAMLDDTPLKGGLYLGRRGISQTPPLYSAHEADIPYSRKVLFHRLSQSITLDHARDFLSQAHQQGILVIPTDREHSIRTQAKELLSKHALLLDFEGTTHKELLAEVVGLTDNPHPFLGQIDGSLRELPPEILTTVMRVHQRYFPVTGTDGSLTHFLGVANKPVNADIVAGNERVLKARLYDGLFFYHQDIQTPLQDFVPKLEKRIFYQRLGTLADRAKRLSTYTRRIARVFLDDNKTFLNLAEQAGYLAKADLATQVVGEFPELQGVVGSLYAARENQDNRIVDALRLQYTPHLIDIEKHPLAWAVAVADRLDTLYWFFAAGITPTGSKDPFALRRAGIGLLQLLLQYNQRDFDSNTLLEQINLSDTGERPTNSIAPIHADHYALVKKLNQFLTDRLENLLKDTLPLSVIRAVVPETLVDPRMVREHAHTLNTYLNRSESHEWSLLNTWKRAANILSAEEAKDKLDYSGQAVDTTLLNNTEQALYNALSAPFSNMFSRALEQVNNLCLPLMDFFNDCTVNDPDPNIRRNRLALLALMRGKLQELADFEVLIKG
jgi:glycyl-tRNA synthetase beta chain